jgi:hypothetical protein
LNNSGSVKLAMFTVTGVCLNVTISSNMSAVGELKYINDKMFLFSETGKDAAPRERKLVSLKRSHGSGQQTATQSRYYLETLSIRICLRHSDVREQCCYLQVVSYFTMVIVHRVLRNLLTVSS